MAPSKTVNASVLAASCLLFVLSALSGAPELCTVLFGACIVVFGVWYTPWDAYDFQRSYRGMFGSARFVALSCFATVVSALTVVGYPDWLQFTAPSTCILSFITYRSILEMQYQRTGDKSILSKFV